MKKLYKLFIPIYGIYYGLKNGVDSIEFTNPSVFFGSAVAQATSLALIFFSIISAVL